MIGIGINLEINKDGFPDSIANKAGYANYNGGKLDLASDIAQNIGEYIKSNTEAIIEEYTKNMAWLGKEVEVTDYADSNKKIEGIILGVNQDCFLKLQTQEGNVRLLSSGEII